MTTVSANESDLTAWNVFQALDLVCKTNPACSELQEFLPKQMWNKHDRQTVLATLSKLFLNLKCVEDIGSYFRPLILDIAERTKKSVLKEGHTNYRLQQKLALALGLVLPVCPELIRFTGEYIENIKPFSNIDEPEEPRTKKRKKQKIVSLHWCRAIYNLTTYLKDARDAANIKLIQEYLSDEDISVRWYAVQTYCKMIGMTEQGRSHFLRQYFTVQEEQECVHKFYQETKQRENQRNLALGSVTLESLESALTFTRYQLLTSDLDQGVVSVTGVLLPRLYGANSFSADEKHLWVGVPSMMDSLRSLALAVSAGQPVLIQGAVGSGKTLLVQHLASLTGRHAAPQIIKVQLGDQTDSKALLGTYQCTEVPGQFVWRPGVLTEAVTKGYWVLLEDLDHAPMEVISTLAPLLQTSALSVPGHGDLIQAAPGFQLFATQRLFASGDGFHSQSKSSAILDKLWTRITIQPFSRTELRQIVVARFPNLSTIVDRLLHIYFMLSAGRHNLTCDISDSADDDIDMYEGSEEDTVGKFLSLTGRLISTRDLMSWCSRVSSFFVPESPCEAEQVLKAALDCFVSCLPNPSRRLELAEAIAAQLSLTRNTAEYFLTKHCPFVEESSRQLTVADISLPFKQQNVVSLSRTKATFSFTRPSVSLLEKVATCVQRNEPVLLVGETGTGKTSSVQYLAHTLGHNLHVINLNQQSDSVDLLGGFKPVDLKFLMIPLRQEFETLFCKTFSREKNVEFMGHIQNCFTQKRWHDLLSIMEHSLQGAMKIAKQKEQKAEDSQKWQKLTKKWKKMGTRIKKLKTQVQETENVLAFSFIEGTLVKALKCGDWVLLDEINLAAAETLQCLAGLLESTNGSLVLTDRGNMDPIVRHPDFRLFACMNPATDVGKKDLTPGIRNRFTEFYVDELVEPSDLKKLVGDYLKCLSLNSAQLKGIVKFYTEIRSATQLGDGTGHKPHYSLRTLCRALRFVRSHNCGTVARSLYEGFCLSFLTQLDRRSHPIVKDLIRQHILGNVKQESILRQPLPQPNNGKYLQYCDYWISQGSLEPCSPENYIMTPSVQENLKDLARIVSAGSHPVLLQGETSVGKTSLITWLARSSGNHCVRVNNHEHTDLQEYVGCYTADESGKLVFKEGVLVEAMRKGHWIILDELNLAPTDVLEALNRLLDDNQELFIPETQEMVKAHPKFMLFATQNPPGVYGGRKMLSRAFRNRFIELHFDEIPKPELETILHKRCGIPLSYAKRMVAVMADLQIQRQQTGLFAGKQSWMTLRDLFRWADRYRSSGGGGTSADKFYNYDQHMADQGFMLLAGRVRKTDEVAVIQTVIEKHFKKCKVGPERLFNLSPDTSPTVLALLQAVVGKAPQSAGTSSSSEVAGFQHIVWTQGMRRLAVLIGQAIEFNEPILLVGDTGCGKTTVCQLYAAMKAKKLHSVNCHLNTESADFLGGLRPVRSHSQEKDGDQKLFEWVDGPLVTSMKEGSMFLIDEISLADDSVLERMNSVLEPERWILLAEKGSGVGVNDDVEVVKAEAGFQVFATMNPGGDFGKKELSPALRNRFTEIWCPQSNERDDFISIIEHNVRPGLCLPGTKDGSSGFGTAIMDFVSWFSNNEIGKRCTVSIRDILSWVNFINTCSQDQDGGAGHGSETNSLEPVVAYIHGACLVFLDSLGAGNTNRGNNFDNNLARRTCLNFLQNQFKSVSACPLSLDKLGLTTCGSEGEQALKMELTQNHLTIFPFSIKRETSCDDRVEHYTMQARTTCINAQRMLRGLQLARPLLLEGAPGVGKTSLVVAVARLAGQELVRINLSEQTDVTDLFGADLPVEGGAGGSFAWRDGPFLQALKAGHWVVFDEMNLASQSVLEGLNACLDHRGEVFVPELARTFHIQEGRTRIFACQNPLNQGGGRKGLPRSFLNRFTQIFVEQLTRDDLIFICSTMYPTIPQGLLVKMVDFNMMIHEETMVTCRWGQRGAPWEFNLRDINRWCDLLLANQTPERFEPAKYVSLIYQDRMRTVADKDRVAQLYYQVFSTDSLVYKPSHVLQVTSSHVQAGNAFLPRLSHGMTSGDGGDAEINTLVLHRNLGPLESLMMCVNMGWMAILVGSSSSGKSSVIRLLAELTGHSLHVLPVNSAMDTTELLGGFEQADIGRHISELTAKVVGEVRLYQQQQSVEGGASAVSIVASLDEQVAALRSCSGEDVQEDLNEKKTLLNRICQLQKLVVYLSSLQPQSEKYSLLSEALKVEHDALNRMQEGAASVGGGTFEWVDSLLVKALRNGDWLLVDNVNFCSPSVLDRLNALLEPRGVLTINERGVTDGSVPTVKPHPDFRLFLSMDPKYGEISRAMRNRGIEIYILGEEDGYPYSQHDTLSMLEGLGLNNQFAIDWLIELHAELRQKLATNERPGLCDLLRCAIVAKQQREKGVELIIALRQAAQNVYVRNMKSLVARKMVCCVLSEQLLKLTAENLAKVCSVGADAQVEWALVAPSVQQFQCHSGFTTAQQAARVFALLLSGSGLESLCPRATLSVNDYLRGLQTAISIFISHQSEKDWRLAFDWLKKLVGQNIETSMKKLRKAPASDDEKERQEGLTKMLQIGETCLKNLFESGAMKELEMQEKTLCQNSNFALRLLRDQPWDLATNPQVLETVMMKMMQPDRNNQLSVPEKAAAVVSTVNRLELLQLVTVLTEQMKEKLALYETFNSKAMRQRSAKGKALVNLYELFIALLNQLPDLVLTMPEASVCLLMQDGLLWLSRLLEESMNSSCKDDMEEIYLSHLALHWNWCWRKVLKHFDFGNSGPVVQSAITKIKNQFGDDTAAAKLFVKFWSAWGHPQAYPSEMEARCWQEFRRLILAVRVHGCPSIDQALQRAKIMVTSDGSVLRRRFAFVAKKLLAHDFDVESDLHDIRKLLASNGIALAESTPITIIANKPVTEADSSTSSHVQLWPVYEFLGLLTEFSCMLNSSTGGEKELLRRLRLQDFEINCSPASLCYDSYSEKNLNQGEQMRWLLQILQRMWNSPAVSNCDRWLTWNAGNDGARTAVINRDLNGPALFHRSALLLYSSHLLSSANKDRVASFMTSQYELLPLDVTLGCVETQFSQLSNFTRMLWKHAGVFFSKKLSPRMLEEELLAKSFLSLLHAVTHIMDCDAKEEWNSLISRFPTSTDSALIRTWQQNNATVKPLLLQLLGHFNQNCSTLKDDGSASEHHTLLGMLAWCFEAMMDVTECQNSATVVGHALVYVGLALFHLLAPRGPVDPRHKAQVKLGHFQQELSDVETDLQVWEAHLKLTRGQAIQDVDPALHHPRLAFLLRRKKHLVAAIANLEQQQAFRGNRAQYLRLTQEVTSLQETMASADNVKNLVCKLRTSVSCNKSEFCSMLASTSASLREEYTWQKTTGQFTMRLDSEYTFMPDLTVPVCLAVEQMRLGMKILSQEASLKLKQSQVQYWPASGMLDLMVTKLCAFPSVGPAAPTWLSLAASLSSVATREAVSCLTDSDQGPSTHHMSRLLLCSLQLLKSHALQTGELTSDACTTLTHVFDLFVKAWKEQEEKERQKQEDEAILYRYKEKTHGDDRTEEEKDEAAFREAFPSFRDDFADMILATRLEDTGITERLVEKTQEAAAPNTITEQEMDEVCTSHMDLLHKLTSCMWVSPQQLPGSNCVKSWDVVKPALLAYRVATDIGKKSWELLSDQVDKHSLGSHLLVCGTLAQAVTAPGYAGEMSQTQVLRPAASKCYNVYIDPNVEEVIQCRPVLQHLVVRVKELQKEWPDHPSLSEILQVVERIESFTVTSPVVKFLFGLELLLEKAQHWERNAASFVSLSTQLSEVTAIIVRWRKLELRCWSGALDIEVERCRVKASHWWFHIYTLTATYLEHPEDDPGMEKLLESLKQFLEGSSFGEFNPRLDILWAFHCQLVHTPSSAQQDQLMRLLWNLYQFYNQFRPAVDAEIARLRAPIEKELKGFVKIARWSEMNYWALKESTEKTHRTVHKHARSFQTMLNQPVKSHLGEKATELLSERTSGTDAFCKNVLAYLEHSIEVAGEKRNISSWQDKQDEVLRVLSQLPECRLQQKISPLCQRAAKYWQSCVKGFETCADIVSLDELTGELLEGANELQKLQIPPGTDKAKEKSEIKHIHMRKRKALADCFKQLASIGLSFRKGLVKEKTNHVDSALQLPPFNPAACFEKGSKLLGLWEGCDKYFTKCLSRLAMFSVATQSPSTELGRDNIQRCDGFVQDMVTIFMKQRQELTNLFTQFISFRKLVSALDTLKDGVHLTPSQEIQQWLESIKKEVTQTVQGLTQFLLLLHACPVASHAEDHRVISPFLPADLSSMANLQHGDLLWNKCLNSVQTYLETANKLQSRLLSFADRILFTSEDVNSLTEAVSNLMNIAGGLNEMSETLNNGEDNQTNCLTATITFLSTSICNLHRNFREWRSKQEWASCARTQDADTQLTVVPESVSQFAMKMECLVESALLSVQNMVKSTKEQDKETGEEGNEDMPEDDLKESHLTALVEQLRKSVAFLDLEKMTKYLEELCSCLNEMTRESSPPGQSGSQVSLCVKLVLHCQPMLGVYREMTEDHVAKSLALHRTMGKMLSVMLAVFTELVSKGFCLPEQYTDEADGTGATDFVDIEGGGLGEGEGVKDVSEQIESEDQLDEAKQPGEKEESTDQQQDIAPEKNAIEMSEDFDAKPQDLEPVEGEEDGNEDNDEDKEELDKQMGEVDGPHSDKLDDQMWGSDEEEEEESDDKKKREEENNAGEGEDDGEKELKAKEDLPSVPDDKKEEEKKDDLQDKEEPEEKIQDLKDFDESEYDDNKTDPHHGQEDQDKEPEAMDLPDDLKLDENEKDEDDGADEQRPDEGEDTKEVDDMPQEGTEKDEGQEGEDTAEDVPEEGTEKEEEGKAEEESEEKVEEKEEDGEGKMEEEKDGEQERGEEEEEEDMEIDDAEKKNEAEKEKAKNEEAQDDEQCDDEDLADKKGFNAPEDSKTGEDQEMQDSEEAEERGHTGQDVQGVQHEDAQEKASAENDQRESEGRGQSSSDQQEGHEGSSSTQVTEGTIQLNKKQSRKRPGESNEDRSLGSADEKFKRLKTMDRPADKRQPNEPMEQDQEAEIYEHITDEKSHADAQTLDVATEKQQKEQAVVGKPEVDPDEEKVDDDDDDIKMMDEKEEEEEEVPRREGRKLHSSKDASSDDSKEKDSESKDEEMGTQVEGETILTLGAERPSESTIHTEIERLHLGANMSEADVETLRNELEVTMSSWMQSENSEPEAAAAAAEAWQKYETLTSSLSQELCEQLRLVLEPSQATKLKGDYRTGRRLNMRKVIPYIASQFRKDKIWLRRTKPSKRQYQIMLAIDDSSSMSDNHSKQLAYESLALIANALTLLETGELAVCSFGDTVEMLHPFTEPFSNQAGASILQKLSFDQNHTRVASMLEQATAAMLDARSKQQGSPGRPETAQLLLIVSDGLVFTSEGLQAVKDAVRKARAANIFLVFIIVDDPKNAHSVLDVKMTNFVDGKAVVYTYMEEFPFPFYLMIRDINTLPHVLSDALRQWFELVTAGAS